MLIRNLFSEVSNVLADCKHGFVKQYTKLTLLVYMRNNPCKMSREREKIS